MAGQLDMGAILGEQLLNAAKIMEEQVEQEIKDLENLDEDDLEAIRRRKLGILTVYEKSFSSHYLYRYDEKDAGKESRMEKCGSWRVFRDSGGEGVLHSDQGQ